MKTKTIFGVLAVFCIVHEISATFKLCNCIGEGKDVCNCKKGIKAPRPFPLKPPTFAAKPLVKTICKEYSESSQPAPAFKPIGDVCNCGQTIVKPAPHPILKPCPCMKGFELPKWDLKHKPSCSCSSCTSAKDSGESHHQHHHECGELKRAPKEYTFEFENRKKSPPQKPRYGEADVVSVAIARQLSNSAKNVISERQLQYGSHKEPTPNRKEEKRVIAVNEDHLYDTRGHVIEIKSSMFRKPESSESASSEEQPKKKPTAFNPGNLRYDDIGYGTYQSHNPRYVIVKNSEANHDCESSKKQPKKNSYGKRPKPCGCAKDLLVEESSLSEQSATFEDNASDQYLQPRSYFTS